MHPASYRYAPGTPPAERGHAPFEIHTHSAHVCVCVFERPAVANHKQERSRVHYRFRCAAHTPLRPPSRSVTYSSPSVVDRRGGSSAQRELSADVLVCACRPITPADCSQISRSLVAHPAAKMKHKETLWPGPRIVLSQPLSLS